MFSVALIRPCAVKYSFSRTFKFLSGANVTKRPSESVLEKSHKETVALKIKMWARRLLQPTKLKGINNLLSWLGCGAWHLMDYITDDTFINFSLINYLMESQRNKLGSNRAPYNIIKANKVKARWNYGLHRRQNPAILFLSGERINFTRVFTGGY